MIKYFFIAYIFFIQLNCDSNKHTAQRNSYKNYTEFKNHFIILDSVVNTNKNDTIYYCCTSSISFMERNTHVDAYSDGTLLGKLSFSKSDWYKWHEWYDKRYKRKKN